MVARLEDGESFVRTAAMESLVKAADSNLEHFEKQGARGSECSEVADEGDMTAMPALLSLLEHQDNTAMLEQVERSSLPLDDRGPGRACSVGSSGSSRVPCTETLNRSVIESANERRGSWPRKGMKPFLLPFQSYWKTATPASAARRFRHRA